jgi:hypothetical protein
LLHNSPAHEKVGRSSNQQRYTPLPSPVLDIVASKA